MSQWNPIPGETPIADISGLIPKHVTSRAQLNIVEAENIRKVIVKYLARLSRGQNGSHLTRFRKISDETERSSDSDIEGIVETVFAADECGRPAAIRERSDVENLVKQKTSGGEDKV